MTSPGGKMSKPKKIQTAKAFTYSKAESNEILKALRRAGFPENANADCLRAITSLARWARDAQPLPPANQIRKEIRRVGKQAAQFAESLSALSPPARLFLDSHLRNDGDPLVSALSPHRLGDLLVRIIEQVNLAAEGAVHASFRRRGRPKEEPTHSFVFALCALYFTATGRLPRRQIDAMTGKPSGRFWAFIKAAIGPTRLPHSDHSVDHLIREALNQFGPAPPRRRPRAMAKNRRPPR